MHRRHIMTILLVCGCLLMAGSVMAKEKVYGKGVSSTDTTLVSQILADPDAYVGKVVRVEGTAVAVCPHRGCWIDLASDQETETIRIKVPDGVIVFPAEIVGERVIAEGVFTANKLDLETSKKYCKYEAEQAGDENFDPAKVTECVTLYQISGTGAVVKDVPNKSQKTEQSVEG